MPRPRRAAAPARHAARLAQWRATVPLCDSRGYRAATTGSTPHPCCTLDAGGTVMLRNTSAASALHHGYLTVDQELLLNLSIAQAVTTDVVAHGM